MRGSLECEFGSWAVGSVPPKVNGELGSVLSARARLENQNKGAEFPRTTIVKPKGFHAGAALTLLKGAA